MKDTVPTDSVRNEAKTDIPCGHGAHMYLLRSAPPESLGASAASPPLPVCASASAFDYNGVNVF